LCHGPGGRRRAPPARAAPLEPLRPAVAAIARSALACLGVERGRALPFPRRDLAPVDRPARGIRGLDEARAATDRLAARRRHAYRVGMLMNCSAAYPPNCLSPTLARGAFCAAMVAFSRACSQLSANHAKRVKTGRLGIVRASNPAEAGTIRACQRQWRQIPHE